jgi:hypothetical protein
MNAYGYKKGEGTGRPDPRLLLGGQPVTVTFTNEGRSGCGAVKRWHLGCTRRGLREGRSSHSQRLSRACSDCVTVWLRGGSGCALKKATGISSGYERRKDEMPELLPSTFLSFFSFCTLFL